MSAAAILARAARRVLSVIGEDAVLRGDIPCKALIERDVQVQRDIGDTKFFESAVTAVVDVAGIDATLAPRKGDTLVVNFELPPASVTYRLDAPLKNSGRIARFTLLKL